MTTLPMMFSNLAFVKTARNNNNYYHTYQFCETSLQINGRSGYWSAKYKANRLKFFYCIVIMCTRFDFLYGVMCNDQILFSTIIYTAAYSSVLTINHVVFCRLLVYTPSVYSFSSKDLCEKCTTLCNAVLTDLHLTYAYCPKSNLSALIPSFVMPSIILIMVFIFMIKNAMPILVSALHCWFCS